MESFINWLKGAVVHNWHTTGIGLLGFGFVWLMNHGVTVDPALQQHIIDGIGVWMLAHGVASKDGNKTGKSE